MNLFLRNNNIRILTTQLFLVSAILVCVSCNSKKETILAKVYDDHLYLSDVSGIFRKDMSTEDSIKMLDLFVDDWVRNKLFENEARKRIPDHDLIEKQVRDYRSSLINYAYENLIIKERLDSLVDEELLYNFYNENKASFKLENAIMRCSFAKIPKTAISKEEFKKLWDADDQHEKDDLKLFCTKNAKLYMLDDSLWNNANEILLQFPPRSIEGKEIPGDKNFSAEDDGYFYFLKIRKYLSRGETAPFSQARAKINDVFLLQRKKEVIEKAKDMILEKESRRHNFSIYTDRVKSKSENK